MSILIFAAGLNLFLFYQDSSHDEAKEAHSIIKIADIKVNSEAIAATAISVANGNTEDKEILDSKIQNVENIIKGIRTGENIDGQTIEKIPATLNSDYQNLSASWENYRDTIHNIQEITVFDKEASNAVSYILNKNNELILSTNELYKEIQNLDRDYSRHKEIAKDLLECSKVIGQQTLLISIGEDVNSQEKLKEKKLQFEIGIRKLLQASTLDLDVQSAGTVHEELIPLPRENSNALRELDPLWESMQVKVSILEERALLSPEFNTAKENMFEQKEIFYSDIDTILENWSQIVLEHESDELIIVQVILGVDIVIFILVLYIIRKSLSPFELITQAIAKMKEGVYGEAIQYSATDEVGKLVENFNKMSNTIKEKEEEAKKNDIAKDEFLAMITHELKTPLVPIQGYADILLSEHLGKLTEKQKERISIIKSSSETLLSIISDLLDAQKLELGQLRMNKTNSGIKDTIEKSLESIRLEIESNNIEVNIIGEDISVEHDPERISQVITNLMKNSILAIQPNKGKIEVKIEYNPNEVVISVIDNGTGIPKDKQKDLFNKFYQVDASLTRERGGSGLGLAICKGIVDNHFGKIWVNSEEGHGSTFSFSIPKKGSGFKTPL